MNIDDWISVGNLAIGALGGGGISTAITMWFNRRKAAIENDVTLATAWERMLKPLQAARGCKMTCAQELAQCRKVKRITCTGKPVRVIALRRGYYTDVSPIEVSTRRRT